MLRPLFAGVGGRREEHPFAAGHPLRVDLAGLARLFTTPVLFGEFAPSSYWQGVDLVWQPPRSVADDRPFRAVFADAVSRACAGADVVAVALSGGVDSLAVLWHVSQLMPRRKVIALVVDLVDDHGDRASVVVHRLLIDLDLADRVNVVVVDPAGCLSAPEWSPLGPRMDALPAVNATVAQRAIGQGAHVLLSGNGADELMSVPRYALSDVASAHGRRGAWRYLSDMAGAGFGRWGELAGWGSRLLPARPRSRAYAAATWPQWCHPEASPALRPRWHDEALAWARAWVRSTLDGHQEADRGWAAADAWDSWWPRAYLPPAVALAEASPFCDEYLASVVWGMPLGWRYVPGERSAYLRVKGQVGQLFPQRVRRLLPSVKRYYATALGNAVAAGVTVEAAADLGLLAVDAVAGSTCTATRMMAAAVEAWLTGAASAGAKI